MDNKTVQPFDLIAVVAFECSGETRRRLQYQGFTVYSVDLQESDDNAPNHVVGDALEAIETILEKHGKIDLLIAHPPCTYLTNSGVRWLYNSDKTQNADRWEKLYGSIDMFNQIKGLPIDHIAIENPIPHKHAREGIGQYDQKIQPWQFGHPESKATCFWLKGLPQLVETDNVKHIFDGLTKKERNRLHYLPPSKDRAKIRSKTYSGIAHAMAIQWGQYVFKQLLLEADTLTR